MSDTLCATSSKRAGRTRMPVRNLQRMHPKRVTAFSSPSPPPPPILARCCWPRPTSASSSPSLYLAYRLGAEAAHRALPFRLGRKSQHNVRHALRDELEARGPDALAGAPFAANAPEARKRLFEPVVPPAPFETPPQTMRVEDRAMSAAAHRLDAAPPGDRKSTRLHSSHT